MIIFFKISNVFLKDAESDSDFSDTECYDSDFSDTDCFVRVLKKRADKKAAKEKAVKRRRKQNIGMGIGFKGSMEICANFFFSNDFSGNF